MNNKYDLDMNKNLISFFIVKVSSTVPTYR